MYRIREVDAQDDDISEMLADLHRLTFFDSAPVPSFDWGLRSMNGCRLPLPDWCRPRMLRTPDIYAVWALSIDTGDGRCNCG